MKKHKWNGYLIAGVIITTIIVLWILIGRFYTPYPPTKMSAAKLQGPSLAHLFGTDKFGRDIFSRVMQGSGTTLFIAALTIIFGMIFLGFTVGSSFGWSKMDALFLGGMISMSSTTIIYKAFEDLGTRNPCRFGNGRAESGPVGFLV